jgi:hypothetical protein
MKLALKSRLYPQLSSKKNLLRVNKSVTFLFKFKEINIYFGILLLVTQPLIRILV